MTTRAPLVVGLDVGTSSAKAAVYTAAGRPVSTGSAATPWSVTTEGVETSAEGLLDCSMRALSAALETAPAGPVIGLGIAGMGESGILLDRAGTPIGPVVAWHDTRDRRDIHELGSSAIGEAFATRTGLPVSGQWSLTKHRWLLRRYPDLAEAARRLNVAEWVVRALGGDEVSEQSLASRTGWLGLTDRAWWPEALEWAGARTGQFPELVTAGTSLGRVATDRGPDRLRGAALTVAGHDHQAASVGASACQIDDELDSCGTAEAMVRTIRPGLHPDAVQTLVSGGITIGWHALAGRWCLMASTQGGLTLQRTLTELGRTDADVTDLDTGIAVALAEHHRGAGMDRSARRNASLTWWQALRSVSADAADIHRAMTAVVGDHRSLVVTGGWSRSTAYLRAKRAALGPFRVSEILEAGTAGAAWFAGIAAGVREPVSAMAPELTRKCS